VSAPPSKATRPTDLAAVARQQNDADFAAGRMPTRYVTDVSVLDQVAVLIGGAGPPTNSKGPGLTNRDLRNTTPRTTEEVVGA
jgi:hypothetical protein